MNPIYPSVISRGIRARRAEKQRAFRHLQVQATARICHAIAAIMFHWDHPIAAEGALLFRPTPPQRFMVRVQFRRKQAASIHQGGRLRT